MLSIVSHFEVQIITPHEIEIRKILNFENNLVEILPGHSQTFPTQYVGALPQHESYTYQIIVSVKGFIGELAGEQTLAQTLITTR